MKKIALTLIAVFAMSATTFAKSNVEVESNIERTYDMSLDNRRLSVFLGLTTDQANTVNEMYAKFCKEMMNAAHADSETRKELTDKAINKNIKWMGYILDHEQYRKYLLILNTTLHNKGIRK